MSIGSGTNNRNAEQKMTLVNDTKEFQDCSMPVLHDSIGRIKSGGIEVSARL